MPRYIHIPTEIVTLIVAFIADEDSEKRRQQFLYKCCLVSWQWYSAAVPFLYERPLLDKGLSFDRFADIVCPSISTVSARRNQMLDFGKFVRRLDLSLLGRY